MGLVNNIGSIMGMLSTFLLVLMLSWRFRQWAKPFRVDCTKNEVLPPIGGHVWSKQYPAGKGRFRTRLRPYRGLSEVEIVGVRFQQARCVLPKIGEIRCRPDWFLVWFGDICRVFRNVNLDEAKIEHVGDVGLPHEPDGHGIDVSPPKPDGVGGVRIRYKPVFHRHGRENVWLEVRYNVPQEWKGFIHISASYQGTIRYGCQRIEFKEGIKSGQKERT